MPIEQYKKQILEFEESKFDKIINLCSSPIEKIFIGKVYSFFINLGISISLITQSLEHFILTEDGQFNSLYYETSENGLKLEMEHKNSQYQNDLTRDPERLCGFTFFCSDVYYEFYPQYPIFNHEQIRYADFVIKVKDKKSLTLGEFVIECDGFAWHSTRSQLANDYHRSRFLTSQGFKIIRYTGSEINRINDNFVMNFENTLYNSIFKKDSGLFVILTTR